MNISKLCSFTYLFTDVLAVVRVGGIHPHHLKEYVWKEEKITGNN